MKITSKHESFSPSIVIVRKYDADDDKVLMEKLQVVFATWFDLANKDDQKDGYSDEIRHYKRRRNN